MLRFDPSYSVQTGIEARVGYELSQSRLGWSGTEHDWCQLALTLSLDLVVALLEEEFGRRFGEDAVVHPHHRLLVQGVPVTILCGDSRGEGAGTVHIRITDGSASGPEARLVQSSHQRHGAMTWNRVVVRVSKTFEGVHAVVWDIAQRAFAALDAWLERHLETVGLAADSSTIREVRGILGTHLGALAEEVFLYPFVPVAGDWLGLYAVDGGTFRAMAPRLRATRFDDALPAVEAAALLETTMRIELTESQRALGTNKHIVCPPNSSGRRYAKDHHPFVRGEDALFPCAGIVAHPVVVAGEHPRLQMVAVYTERCGQTLLRGATVTQHIEALRPRILARVQALDLAGTMLRTIQQRTDTGARAAPAPSVVMRVGIPLELSQATLREQLRLWICTPPPGAPDWNARVLAAALAATRCRIPARAELAAAVASGFPSMSALCQLEDILRE